MNGHISSHRPLKSHTIYLFCKSFINDNLSPLHIVSLQFFKQSFTHYIQRNACLRCHSDINTHISNYRPKIDTIYLFQTCSLTKTFLLTHSFLQFPKQKFPHYVYMFKMPWWINEHISS